MEFIESVKYRHQGRPSECVFEIAQALKSQYPGILRFIKSEKDQNGLRAILMGCETTHLAFGQVAVEVSYDIVMGW